MKLSLLTLALVACGGHAAASSAQSPSGRGGEGAPATGSAGGAGSAAPAGSGVATASASAPAPDASWIAAGPAFDAQSPFAGAGLDGIAKKLEGAWFVKLGNGRQREAWDVHGNTAVVANKGGAKAYALTVTSPCTLEIKEKDGGSTESHFVFDGDTLYLGMGDYGVKTQDGVVACVSDGIYELKKGKCDKYLRLGGHWDKKPAKCVLTKDAFEVKADFGGKVDARGSVFLSDDPELLKAVKVASLGEGTAKLAE
jgi:hypothetical protein